MFRSLSAALRYYPLRPADTTFNNVFGLDTKMGYDIGIYGGYDFGGFRVEGEVDWKHANLDDLEVDVGLLDAFNAIDTMTGSTTLVDTDFDVDEAVGSLAFMINGLADFGDQDGLSFQAGLGFGWNKVKLIDDKDGALAWQAILGLQYALSPNIDLGVRYKYFSSGNLDFGDGRRREQFVCLAAELHPDPACWRSHGRHPDDHGGCLHGPRREVPVAQPGADAGLQLRQAAAAASAAAAAAAASAAASGDADVPGRIGDPGDGMCPVRRLRRRRRRRRRNAANVVAEALLRGRASFDSCIETDRAISLLTPVFVYPHPRSSGALRQQSPPLQSAATAASSSRPRRCRRWRTARRARPRSPNWPGPSEAPARR